MHVNLKLYTGGKYLVEKTGDIWLWAECLESIENILYVLKHCVHHKRSRITTVLAYLWAFEETHQKQGNNSLSKRLRQARQSFNFYLRSHACFEITITTAIIQAKFLPFEKVYYEDKCMYIHLPLWIKNDFHSHLFSLDRDK